MKRANPPTWSDRDRDWLLAEQNREVRPGLLHCVHPARVGLVPRN